MTAHDLLADLRRRGLTVALAADLEHVEVEGPADALTAELRQAIAAHKAGIIEALAQPAPGPLDGFQWDGPNAIHPSVLLRLLEWNAAQGQEKKR